MNELTPALERQTWNLAGVGAVGDAVRSMVADPEVAARYGLHEKPEHILRTDGWHEHSADGDIIEADAHEMPDADVLFVALPPMEGNELAYDLLERQLGRGAVAVTAEKATLAEHVTELLELPGQLGYWGAYGGGTRLLDKLRLDTIDPRNIRELYKSPNGTMNFALGMLALGYPPDSVAYMAGHHRYIEPRPAGSPPPSLAEIFMEEIPDVGRKEVVALKMTLPGFDDLSLTEFDGVASEDDIERVMREPARFRYLNSNFPAEAADLAAHMHEGRLAGSDYSRAGFLIGKGFMPLDREHPDYSRARHEGLVSPRPLELFAAVPGPTAAYYIHHRGPNPHSTDDGWSFSIGTGAGADATANAMLDNYLHLRRRVETASRV